MAMNNPKVVFKILILGDAMVGKSSLLQRYADDRYTDIVPPTIGVDYRPVYRKFRGQLTKLMIWDTAGQEKFKSITKSYYHGAHGAIIVYDVAQKATLYGLPKWLSDLKHIAGHLPIVIVGNKNDSKSKVRLTEEEINPFIYEMGYADNHFLVSARTGDYVSQVFETLTGMLMDNNQIFGPDDEFKINLRQKKTSNNCPC